MADPTKPMQSNSGEAASNDLQLMAQVAVDLHIARRNFLIYPVTHEQALRSLDRVYERLGQVLSQQPRTTLVVHKDGLAVGKRVLSAKNTVFKDLAGVLKQYQIATLSFTKGLKKDELIRFLKLVVTDRDTVMDQGGTDHAVMQAGFSHIEIQTVDYGNLQVTKESHISRSSNGQGSEGSIWQQFVARLTDKRQPNEDGSMRLPQTAFDPEQLAGMLNSNEMDVDLAIGQYEAVFAALSNFNEPHESLSEGLPQFQQMIKELTPGLQNQFLSATFDQCGQLATIADVARLVDGLGGDLLIQMLKQASDQDKALSPSLLAFVKKMAHLGAPQADPASAANHGPEDSGLGADEVETLLAHEQYDQYVDKGYGDLLEKIVARSQKSTSADMVSHFQQDLEKSLSAVQINSHVARAMIALMNNSPDIDGYRQWARQLAYMLDDLLESHAFRFMTRILHYTCREKEGGDAEKSKIASLVLDRFSDPQFVARAVEIVQEFGEQASSDAMDFLAALGEPVVVEIFEGLDPNETFCVQDCVSTTLLDSLAAFTAREAIERLDDPRPDYVRRMIRIIRRMGDHQGAEHVRLMLQHNDLDVRMEALATLLKFRNKWGLIRLRDILDDPLAPEFQGAIKLAGRYKVVEALPQLMVYAERGGGDRERQEAVLRALGDMGDVRAVPVLNKLARRRWSMSQKHNHHIKRVVFETLAGYPLEAVKTLIHFGFKQKDAAIKSCCEQVLRNQLRH